MLGTVRPLLDGHVFGADSTCSRGEVGSASVGGLRHVQPSWPDVALETQQMQGETCSLHAQLGSLDPPAFRKLWLRRKTPQGGRLSRRTHVAMQKSW